MMGGIDISLPTRAGDESIEVAVRALRQRWPHAVFENSDTGERYDRFWQVPFGQIDELFVYRNEEQANQWDEHGAIPELKNTMIHLMADNGLITVVIDERDANTERIIDAIESGLSDAILYLEAA